MSDYLDKRVLVTGGCGFVGTNLVNRLLKEGAIVTVLDDMFTGNSKHLPNQVSLLFESSVCDGNVVDALVGDADYIFHLAARNIIASTKSPFEDYQTNIGGTLNILMAMKKHKNTRMVYTSSASVYGNPKYLPINEDDGINLLTPYAVSKYAGEGYCMAFHESYKTPVAVLRLSNVYGTYQSPSNPYCGVVAKFMERAKTNQDIGIHGDGLSTRDFTYVDDVVEALLIAGLSPQAEGEVFNVATGIETDINTLASNVIDVIGPKYDQTLLYNHETDMHPNIVHIDRRDIDNIRRRVLNIEKIRRKLGWMPKTTLYNGLILTKSWMEALNE